MICPWDECQVKGDKNEISQRRAKLLADAVTKSKDRTWKLYQFPSLSNGNNETELKRDVLVALSRAAMLRWMFKIGVKEATVWKYAGQVSDWAYFDEEFENVVEQPYLHYENVMKQFLTPENMFSDKEYGTVDHTTHITHILYYEPQLLVYDNRAPVRSPLRPSFLGIGGLFRSAINFVGDVTGFNRLLGGLFGSSGVSQNLPEIDPDLYVMQFEDLSKPENNVTFRELARNNKILFVIPPTIMFQYSGKSLNSESVPKPYMRSAVGLDDNTNLLFQGTRLKDDYRSNKTIKSFALSPQERIIRVNSVCNYRFEFVTNMGRSLIVGDYDMLAQADQCQGVLQMTDEYNGNDTPLPSQQPPFPTQLMPGDVKQDKVWNPLQQSEGPPGYCLQYMEGSKGGMWAYRWHWVKAPSAYTMYNMVFQYEASNAMAGSQPTQAIAIDLYNHSPLVQSVSASHTLSLTSSSSFTNIDTTEMNWNIGVSMSVEMNEQVGAMGEVTALTTVGFSAGLSSSIGGSQSHTTEYGKSVSDEVSDTQTLTATVPPSSKVTATLLVFSGTVDIPYTADVKIDYYSGESEHIITRGIFTNVKTTSIMVTYSDAQPIEFSPAAVGM